MATLSEESAQAALEPIGGLWCQHHFVCVCDVQPSAMRHETRELLVCICMSASAFGKAKSGIVSVSPRSVSRNVTSKASSALPWNDTQIMLTVNKIRYTIGFDQLQ